MRMLLAAIFGLVLMAVSAPQAAASTFDIENASNYAIAAQKCSSALTCDEVGEVSIAFATGARAAVASQTGCGVFSDEKPTVTHLAVQFATGSRGAPPLATTTLWASRHDGRERADAAPTRKRPFLRRLFS